MNSPNKTKWRCRECFKYLSSKRSYDEHMNIHNESRPFACDQCDYSAASQMTLRRHKLRNHVPRHAWGYQCPYCGEAYMEPASYQQHVLTRHFGRSATFGCPQGGCPFTTKSSKHFREHVKKHIIVLPSRNSTKFYSLRSDFNIAVHIVDDELGSGYGKEALLPIAHRVSGIFPTTKSSRVFGLKPSRKEFSDDNDADFFKTPLDLGKNRILSVATSSTNESFKSDINFKQPDVEIRTYQRLTNGDNNSHDHDKASEKRSVSEPGYGNDIDWIEAEIVIDDVIDQPRILPDGQVDIELD